MRSCLIADDHALMRSALAGLIARRWPDANIVEAGDFATACDAATALETPALAIVDLDMPGSEPLAGVEALRAVVPSVPVLIVTGTSDDALMRRLLATGVAGFAHKTESPDVLLAAIELVLAGGRYIPARIANLLEARAEAPRPLLTARQEDVVRRIAQGRSNKEIALDLGLSPATVKSHVAQAMAAIGATNRTEAAVKARAAGLA